MRPANQSATMAPGGHILTCGSRTGPDHILDSSTDRETRRLQLLYVVVDGLCDWASRDTHTMRY